MKIVAITACPTGIAHTYMAAEALKKEAHKMGITIKVETQGAMGIESMLSSVDITNADIVLIASDIEIEQRERFTACKIISVTIEAVLMDVTKVLTDCQQH